jgi:acetyl-CoA carboxylase alpha subunit
VTVAEPGALIGFLGPKVYRALRGEPFPDNVQTAENLYTRGVVDAVLSPRDLRSMLMRLLAVLALRPTAAPISQRPDRRRNWPSPTAWASITATRRADRPGVRDLLDRCGDDVVELHGTGSGEVAAATVLCLARFGRAACILVGQDRRAERPPGPADLRVARRGMALARELRIPLVTVIDTPGGELSRNAENGALAGEIARCLVEMVDLAVPTLSVLLGQGAGGVALALLPADRRIAARNAWLAPLPPEGAEVIVHGTIERAADVVASQWVRSTDLVDLGAVDVIVEEFPDASAEPTSFIDRLAETVENELLTASVLERAFSGPSEEDAARTTGHLRRQDAGALIRDRP